MSGIAITNTTNSTYLKYESIRVYLLFLSLGVLILYSSSCASPIGQRKPQMVLPSNRPKTPRIPKMKYGVDLSEVISEFCNAPKGHAAIAPGQE